MDKYNISAIFYRVYGFNMTNRYTKIKKFAEKYINLFSGSARHDLQIKDLWVFDTNDVLEFSET